jgi:hypothetical protein
MLPAELSEGITSLNENQGPRGARDRVLRGPAGTATDGKAIARWCATARNWPTTRGRVA